MEAEVKSSAREDNWQAFVRVCFVEREGTEQTRLEENSRKRKWESTENCDKQTEGTEREIRRMPLKKLIASVGEMGGGGASSGLSHMSPVWPVNDLDLDLPPELSMNEALLALPSLAGFKQEAPSPTGAGVSPPRRSWPLRRHDERQLTVMALEGDRDEMDTSSCQLATGQEMVTVAQHSTNSESMQCQSTLQAGLTLMAANGYHSPNNLENKGDGLLMCSPVSSLDGFLHSPPHHTQPMFKDDMRFQYVLAAATSIATKQNEETLTYLNQGQPYEVKLKKLGDLSHFKGKILKSIIKICFHERRLQYMEREQIAQWHADRPAERILEIDVPLSYGVMRVQQSNSLNALHIYWDPTKDVGVYIKVNCISTEFTAKKHGGEKGVPFRIQVETYLASDETTRLHAAACQIKVFKLKGADRKHKQDREKVMRRPRSDLDKYQPGCEATVLTTLSIDALLPPPSLVSSSPSYSPEMCVTPKAISSPILSSKPIQQQQSAVLSSPVHMKPLYCQESEMKVNSSDCQSPGAILPDLPQPAEDPDKINGFSKDATAAETQSWLTRQRFTQHVKTFANFSGADLLRLSRDDLIQICGLADGIRLYNALHAKRIEPRLTIYVCLSGSSIYSALYLHTARANELLHKLKVLIQGTAKECDTVLVSGPNGARVKLSDELVRHLPDNSTYTLDQLEDYNALLLSPTTN